MTLKYKKSSKLYTCSGMCYYNYTLAWGGFKP